MIDVRTEIYEKARAGFPAVYILTHEDRRVQSDVIAAARDLGRKVRIWTLGKGIQNVDTEAEVMSGPVDETEDPAQALSHLFNDDERDDIVILRHFHHHLEEPYIQILFIDLAQKFKLRKRMLIVDTPVLKIPTEIEKLVALVEDKLPSKDQIREKILDSIIRVTNVSRKKDKKPELDIPNSVREDLANSALGLTLEEAGQALSLAILRSMINGKPVDPNVVMEEKCSTLKKTGLLQYFPPTEGIDVIGGMGNLKEWIKVRSKAFTDEAKAFGLKSPKGVLMVGPPGTGKSLGAKAISGYLHKPLLRCDMGKIFGGIVGQSEGNVRKIIEVAEAVSPCILWIDEIEKGLAGSSSSGQTDSGVSARVLGTLLTWIDNCSMVA